MKTYRVSSDLKNFVRRVLVRSFYSCRMTKDKNGQWYCTTNASSDTFHKIVQRAKCEKLTKETGAFHVTNRERNNELYLTYLLDASGVSAYQVVNDKDGSSNHHVR